MKIDEAIELLSNATYSDEWQGNEELTTANSMAINALGKQIAQQPIVRGLGQRYCPTCKCGGANDLYCSKCGQKLRY